MFRGAGGIGWWSGGGGGVLEYEAECVLPVRIKQNGLGAALQMIRNCIMGRPKV